MKVDVSVSGTPGLGYVGMDRFLRLKIFRPRSSALICRKSNYKTHAPYREIVFGERKDGDFIVHAKRKSISATETHLPRHKIEFRDNNVVLTAVSIRLNVSKQIDIRFGCYSDSMSYAVCLCSIYYTWHRLRCTKYIIHSLISVWYQCVVYAIAILFHINALILLQ